MLPNGFRRTRLAGDTASMFTAFALRVALQAAFFVVIARSLGVASYGGFMAAAALSAVAAPFAGLGSGNLLVKNLARDPREFAHRWGDALARTVLSGMALLLVVLAAAAVFAHDRIPFKLLLLVGISDLLFLRILDAAGQAYQGLGRLSRTAQVQVVPNVAKLAAAILLALMMRHPTAQTWAAFYLASSIVPAAGALYIVRRELGKAIIVPRRILQDIREGFHFSVGQAAQNVYNDLDKTMLGTMSTATSVGIYAAAYRIVDVSFTPVRSLLFASYADFFKVGVRGIDGTTAHARRLLPFALTAGLTASLGLFALAPVAPLVLGRDYFFVVAAIRWLAIIPLLRSVHYMAADSLTGAGFQSIRSHVQLSVAALNFLANLWLIPRYSWRGAAWASIGCDGMLALGLWCAVVWLKSRTRDAVAISTPAAVLE